MKKLITAAIEAREKAYAPYSYHPVGAAVLTENGEIFSGCNIENASTPLGNCAEVMAIGNMVMAGHKEIQHLVVAGPAYVACTPCGGCRQRTREFAGKETKVTVVDRDGKIMLETTADALLPHSFGPDNVFEVLEGDA